MELGPTDDKSDKMLPDPSVERWKTGFIPEAEGTHPPVMTVGGI